LKEQFEEKFLKVCKEKEELEKMLKAEENKKLDFNNECE
jgi:hypothetical protein